MIYTTLWNSSTWRVFRSVAKATEEARKYNRARLQDGANAKEIKVGDIVLLKANEPQWMMVKWDFGYSY